MRINGRGQILAALAVVVGALENPLPAQNEALGYVNLAPENPRQEQQDRLAEAAFDDAMRSGANALNGGNFEAALVAFRKALEVRPDDPQALRSLALALMRLERYREAIVPLERALYEGHENADSWILLGRLLAQHDGSIGALMRAAEAYERALELRPADPQIGVSLARTYRLGALYEEGLRVLDELAAVGRTGVPLQIERARLQVQLGSYREAQETLEAAIAAGAGAVAHYDLGIVLRNLADLGGARAAFEGAIRLRPGFGAAYLRLGNVQISRQEFAAATETLRRAVDLTPASAEAHNLLGFSTLKIGDAAAAIAEFERALELDPGMAQAAYNAALALRDLGRVNESRAMMQRFEELEAEESSAEVERHRRAEIAVIKAHGLYYLRRGQAERAVERFDRALALEPDDDLLYLNLGLAHAALDQHADAAGALERALEINPERPETYAGLAATYRALGRDADADRMEARYRVLTGQIPSGS